MKIRRTLALMLAAGGVGTGIVIAFLGNSRTAPGVFDVKSGSDPTAIDGSHYANW
jgi:hypothetical protein